MNPGVILVSRCFKFLLHSPLVLHDNTHQSHGIPWPSIPAIDAISSAVSQEICGILTKMQPEWPAKVWNACGGGHFLGEIDQHCYSLAYFMKVVINGRIT